MLHKLIVYTERLYRSIDIVIIKEFYDRLTCTATKNTILNRNYTLELVRHLQDSLLV